MKKVFLVLRWILLVASLGFLLEELVRVSLYVFGQWGLRGLIDGAMWYEVDQGLVLAPFLIFLLYPRFPSNEAKLSFIHTTRWLLYFGAAISILAFLNLRLRVPWAWWGLALALLGWLLPKWMQHQTLKGRRFTPILVGAVVLVPFLLNFGVSFLGTGYFFAPLPATPPPPAATREARWQQDLGYLASELPRLHKNYTHTTSQADFEAAVSALSVQIPSLSDAQIITGLMRIVALVGDGHTSLSLNRIRSFHQFPLKLYWFEDGLYVVKVDEEYAQALGAKVTAIGSQEIQTAFQQVSSLISHENQAWLLDQSPSYLTSPEILQALGILPQAETGHYTFQAQDGQPLTLDLKAVELSTNQPVNWTALEVPTPLYQQNAQENFWYQELPDQKLLYFKYNACVPFGFGSFNSRLWKAVDDHQLAYVVVDFRGNGGGSSQQFSEFLKGLKKRLEINKAGHIFGIIDRGTFSSAMLNAIELRRDSPALLFGEPTGGKPNSYGEVRYFRLRNSKLSVSYSTSYFKEVEGDPESLFPDRRVELSFKAFLTGRDPVMEAILKEINSTP